MTKQNHRGILFKYADAFENLRPASQLYRLKKRYDLIISIMYGLPGGYSPGRIKDQKLIHIGSPDWSKKQHIYMNLLDGLAAHKIATRAARPRVFIPPNIKHEAGEWIENNIPDSAESFIVAVNTGSGFKFKRWMLSRYIRVCRWLIAEFGVNLVVVSQTRRETTARKLYNSLPARHASWLVNKPVDFVAGILSKVDMVLGNDSGIGHLASAVGTPTVTLFGPTSPMLWKPAGKNSIVAFRKKLECGACGYDRARKCKNQVCLTEISDHDVADAILMCINRFVGRGLKPELDSIKVAGKLRKVRFDNGTIMTNLSNNRPFLIRFGFEQVSRILKKVRQSGSYTEILRQFPWDKHLIDFLILHRIVISASEKKYYRNL